MTNSTIAKHTLPTLPYDFAALEPHIDARTMDLHYQQHHAAYVRSLNKILETAPEFADKDAVWLLANLNKIPEEIRATVKFNAGGHVNHSLFWRSMSPGGGGVPTGPLVDAIKQAFTSFESFKQQFEHAGNQLLGPGWVWLIQERYGGGQLKIVTTQGHDNPLSRGYLTLLVSDLWEHAYYLKYENKRADYMRGWWSVVHWDDVALRLAKSKIAFTSTASMNDAFFENDLEPVLLSRKSSQQSSQQQAQQQANNLKITR